MVLQLKKKCQSSRNPGGKNVSLKITNHQDCNKENKPTMMGSYMIISKEAKKTCDKTQYPYLTKKKQNQK